MSKRFALLYNDGSFNVCDDSRDIESSPKWLGYQHADEAVKFVEVEIKVIRVINDKNPRFQVATEHSANCPTCGTEVYIEMPLPPKPEGGK